MTFPGWVRRRLFAPMRSTRRRGHCAAANVENLEDRVLLTTYLVDEYSDRTDGDYSTSHLSLREAIQLANLKPGPDVIEFHDYANPNIYHDIRLTQGPLEVTDDMEIRGFGRHEVTVFGGDFRFFQIQNATRPLDVTIERLEFQSGNPGPNSSGGAIEAFGDLLLNGVNIRQMRTSTGAVIEHHTGDLVIVDSAITENTSADDAGAVASDGTSMTIINSTFAENRGKLGAIHSAAGTAVFRNVTIADNDATGLFVASKSDVTLFNTLIIHNEYGDIRGGRTVNGNSSHNLLGDPSTAGGLVNGTNSNIVGAAFDDVAFELQITTRGTLPILPLKAGSPALNSGDNSQAIDENSQPLSFDQRGDGFDRILNGTVDIGAAEDGINQTYTVDLFEDEDDGDYSPGDLSFREAIRLANSTAVRDTIEFPRHLNNTGPPPRVIALQLGEIPITNDLWIYGMGEDSLVIDAGFNSRIFSITADDVYIRSMTLRNGNSSNAPGGAIFAEGNLTLSGMVIENSRTDLQPGHDGGALAHANGKLILNNGMIFRNNRAYSGGGISSKNSQVFIARSDFLDNEAVSRGGGAVLNGAEVAITLSTFSKNFAYDGGGLSLTDGTLDVQTSNISGNFASFISGGIGSENSDTVILGSTITKNRGTGLSLTGGTHHLINSTISSNSTPGNGGGILIEDDGATLLTIRNATIVLNRADSDGDASGSGGGIASINRRETIPWSFSTTPSSRGTPSARWGYPVIFSVRCLRRRRTTSSPAPRPRAG